LNSGRDDTGSVGQSEFGGRVGALVVFRAIHALVGLRKERIGVLPIDWENGYSDTE
jgi:hypothetical protein